MRLPIRLSSRESRARGTYYGFAAGQRWASYPKGWSSEWSRRTSTAPSSFRRNRSRILANDISFEGGRFWVARGSRRGGDGRQRGMGAAERALFASEGARVVICDIRRARGRGPRRRHSRDRRRCRLLYAPICGCRGMAGASRPNSRGVSGKLDILINNAASRMRVGLLGTEPADWQRVLSINLPGAFLGIPWRRR